MSNYSVNDFPLEEGGMEDRLWDYIDGNSKEASVIEALIREHAGWKEKYAALLDVHQLISQTELEHPPLRFTKNVMDRIARHRIAPAAKKYIDTKIVWGIAAFFILMISGFLAYGLYRIDWSAGSRGNPLGINLGALDYSKLFDNSIINGFMMMNILLGLLLLDRFLSMKRKAYRQGTSAAER